MNKIRNKTVIFATLLAAMMVMAGIAAAEPDPNNSVLPPDSVDIASSAIINNGLIQLGVNDQGHLNVCCGTPSMGSRTRYVGLRFMPTNAEATAPGCLCEGWGAADSISRTSGYANIAVDGVRGMTLVSFVSNATTATSIVNIGSKLQVKHFYHPSVSPNLYQADVSITNIGSTSVVLLYRRVMDWDVEPTYFHEYVTINTGTAANLTFTSNNGFASANPLSGRSSLGFTGSFVDAGPFDHGALFDFNFGTLAPGETKEFKIFYGAAATEVEANASIAAVKAEAYSFGQPGTPSGKTLGTPNTFIFAFAGIGGAPIPIPGVNKPPVANPGGPYAGNEGSAITFDGSASFDPDAGDSIVKYEWDLDNDSIFETNGMIVSKTWPDDHSGTVTLKVTDTKGATNNASTTVTVNNVAPTVTLDPSYYVTVPITLRIAGQGKVGNSVELQVIQDGAAIATSGKIIRTPGSPNEQEVTLSATIDLSKPYSGRLLFDTETAISGGTPVWVIIDGVTTKVTTFNTQKNDPSSYHQTYDFALAGLVSVVGKELTFKATASDPGTDDLTFDWDFGDGGVLSNPYPWSGSHTVTDTVKHTYTAAGTYAVSLKVTDDDGGAGTASKTIQIS